MILKIDLYVLFNKTKAFYFLILFTILSCSESIKDSSPELVLKIEDQNSYLSENIEKAEHLSFDLNDHSSAYNLLEKISKNTNSISLATDSLISEMHHKLGVFSYRMGEFHQAINSLDIAVTLRSKDSTNLINLSNSLYVRSLSHSQNLFYTKALNDMYVAIELEELYFKRPKLLGEYYAKLAHYYSCMKDYSNSKKYFDQALHRLTLKNLARATCLNDYAKFLTNIGNKEEALKCYEEAHNIYLKFPNRAMNISTTKFNILSLEVEQLGYFEKLEKYRLFLDFEKSLPYNMYDQKLIMNCYNNMAYYNLENGEIRKGMKNYGHFLSMARDHSNSEIDLSIARGLEGFGDAYNHLQDLDSSAYFYHLAIQSICIGYENDDVFDFPNPKNHVILHHGELERFISAKAKVLFNNYYPRNNRKDLESLIQMYEDIDTIINYFKNSFSNNKAKFDLLERTAYLKDKAIKVAIKLYEITDENQFLEEAYFFASKNKAIVLLDEKEFESNKLKGIPESILVEEKKLLKEITAFDEKIIASKNSNPIDSTEFLIAQRFERFRKLELFRSDIKRKHPKYYNLKYEASSKINLEEIRTNLEDSTAVIEFYIGQDSIYAFYFSKNQSLKYCTSKKQNDFEKDCVRFRTMIEKDSLFNFQQFSAISNDFYKLLFDTPLKELQIHEPISRLSIIPDGHLLQMSFDAITTETQELSNANSWTSTPSYLLNDYALSIAYSNQLLFNESKNQRIRKSLENYIGFGLAYKKDASLKLDSLSLNNINVSVRNKFGELFHSCDEIGESAIFFDGVTYLNNQATKERFLSQAKKAKILHVAAHGFISKEYPLSSGLIMSNHKNKKDNVLKAADIYTLSLNCEMTILSACQTANGIINKGEGIQSLARAFYYAGCPNVVASLWNAPDYSTKEIVVDYFRYIKKGLPKDIALQKAKLDYLDNCEFNRDALPCNWAHLISTGSQDPIAIKESWSFW